MNTSFSRSLAMPFALLAFTAASVSAARAQIGPMDPSSALQRRAEQAPDGSKAPVVQPPALPGAGAHNDTPAPANRPAADMTPNEALFDAINRGDVAAARDAMNRGAELSAVNVLGMNPMELSVDLGRNEISFLLLSYRGTDNPKGQMQAEAKAAAKAKEPSPPVQKAAAKPAARPQTIPVNAAVPAAPQTPRLFANDGGAPVPGAGFLGFDAGQRPH